MMYSEFVAGTGCKENDHNYKVFKNLEVMYMNRDMSKSEIYEYGKKLVDNSKSEKELKIEAEINGKIESLKAEIESEKSYIEWKSEMQDYWKANDKEMFKMNANSIKATKQRIRDLKNEIASYKWILES